jgi:hypothetical protein
MIHEVLSRRGRKTRNLNRRRAIRHHCLMCSNFDWIDVLHCRAKGCILHPYRLGGLQERGLTPIGRAWAIVRFCTDCCYGRPGRRVECNARECALFPYRNG